MLILKLGQIIDVLIDDDPEIVWLVVRGDLALREYLGHSARRKGDRQTEQLPRKNGELVGRTRPRYIGDCRCLACE
jgi:hypothetical protein